MSDSDILSVQLWWGAAAIAFLAVGMSAAGWKHRYFVGAMFALAALLVLVAFFWRRIFSHLGEQASGFIGSLANSPLAWLVIFILGMGAILIITRMRRSPKPQHPKDPMRGSPYAAVANPNLTINVTQTNNIHYHIESNPSAVANQAFAVFQPDGTLLNSQNVSEIIPNAANPGHDFILKSALMDPQTMRVVAVAPTSSYPFRQVNTAGEARLIFDGEVPGIIAVKIIEK